MVNYEKLKVKSEKFGVSGVGYIVLRCSIPACTVLNVWKHGVKYRVARGPDLS